MGIGDGYRVLLHARVEYYHCTHQQSGRTLRPSLSRLYRLSVLRRESKSQVSADWPWWDLELPHMDHAF